MVTKNNSRGTKKPLGYYLSPEEQTELEVSKQMEYIERDKQAISDLRTKRLNKSIGAKLLKGAITSSKVLDKRIPSFEKKRFVRPNLTKDQMLLKELFGGSERTWGTGQSLPKLHRTLTTGGGIIKSGDNRRETASLFGFG